MNKRKHLLGFTIVELLIVIVVIGILAATSIAVYANMSQRAIDSKIMTDLASLNQAIVSARNAEGKTLSAITGASSSYVTGDGCGAKPNGTDLASLPKTDDCWVRYEQALSKISQASGVDVNSLIDPWGRPYFIYENEGRTTADSCTKDQISIYTRPFTQWGSDYDRRLEIANSLANC